MSVIQAWQTYVCRWGMHPLTPSGSATEQHQSWNSSSYIVTIVFVTTA